MDPKEIQAESWMEKTVEPTSAWRREKRLKAVGAVAGVVLLAAVLAMLFRPKAPTVLIIEEGALENARFVPAASQPEPEPLLYMALKQTLLSGNGIYTFPASTPVTIGAQSAREIRRVQVRIGSGSIQTLAGTMVQTVFPDDAPTGALIPVSIRGEKRNGGTTEWKTYAVMLCPEPEGDAPFTLCVGGKWVPAGRAVEAEEGQAFCLLGAGDRIYQVEYKIDTGGATVMERRKFSEYMVLPKSGARRYTLSVRGITAEGETLDWISWPVSIREE